METVIAFFKKLTGNIGLKLVSLGLAFLLWLFVVSIENPVMNMSFSSIPVTIENANVMEEQGKAFELSDSSRTVTVSVKAERSVLSELSRDNIKASIDMADLQGNKVPITVKATRYSDRIQSINPAKEYATVIIEDLAYSQFRIQVETTGNVMNGYAVGTTSLQNNVVRVSGPESQVSSIAEAVARVNVTGMSSEIHTEVPLSLLDENGNAVDTSTLDVSLTQVIASVEIWKVEEIPVNLTVSGVPAAGYLPTGVVTASPSTVFVTGESKSLRGLSSISVPETELDITGATGNVTKDINISSFLPEGVYLDTTKSDGMISVTAEITEASSSVIQVPYANLQVTGLPEGMVIGNDPATSVVAVTIRGLKATINAIDGASVTGVLDISEVPRDESGNITPGSYAGQVTLALPEGVTQDTTVAHVLLQVNGNNEDNTGEGEEAANAGEGNAEDNNRTEEQ